MNWGGEGAMTLGGVFGAVEKMYARMRVIGEMVAGGNEGLDLSATLNTPDEEKYGQLCLVLMVSNRDDQYRVIRSQFETMYRNCYRLGKEGYLEEIHRLYPQYSYCAHIDTFISSVLHEMDYVKNMYYQLYHAYEAEYLYCLPCNIVHGFDLLYQKVLKKFF